MIVHKIIVGPLQTNCYVVADEETKEAVIIDPGDEPGKIVDFINKKGLKAKQIILTHSHFDHVGAVEDLKKEFSIDCQKLKEGDKIDLGEIKLKIIETPGHTEDSLCLVNESEETIFTGDTLFKQGIGRTDFPGGDSEKMQRSLKRLMEFPNHFKIYPGHGDESTIGEEEGFW